jgi:hypothetical protein
MMQNTLYRADIAGAPGSSAMDGTTSGEQIHA